MRMFIEIGFRGLYYFLKDVNYRSFVWLMLRYGSVPRFSERTIKVQGILLKVPDVKSFLWQFHEIFYKKSYQFTATKENPTIVDCGANVGTSCLYFKMKYPGSRVYAFEPDPEIFAYLSENVRQNNATNIDMRQQAVWTEDTVLHFQKEGADGGTLSGKGQGTVEVSAISLKDFLKDKGEIDLLKIDIEGAEVEVIQDCEGYFGNVHRIFVEYHSYKAGEQHLDQLLSVLSRSGYRYYLESESYRKIPFVNPSSDPKMDMQVNIFAYKDKL